LSTYLQNKQTMYTTILSEEEFEASKQGNLVSLYYFSHDECNVCKVLKPKIEELFSEEFPETKLFYVNTKTTSALAAQNRIFAVPTLIIFIEGKEFIRKSRNIGISELHEEMQRPYQMIFE